MSIGLLLLITIILTVCIYVLLFELPKMRRAELSRRREFRNDIRAREEQLAREMTKLYIDTVLWR